MTGLTQADARKVLLAGAVRALDLLRRMPRRFKRRGWDLDDRCHIASAAVACVALRVGKTPFNVPPGTDDPPEWRAIVGKTTAEQIVEALELQDMLKPEALKSCA